MADRRIVSIEDRIPKLKQQRRKKANRRLALILFLFFSLIASVIYFQSPLSHVKNIIVLGNHIYSKSEIISNMDVSQDTSIWKIDHEQIVKNVKRLPEINSASVKVVFPNNLEIRVNEYKRCAYLADQNKFLPILDNGEILKKQAVTKVPSSAPILFGFSEGDPLTELISGLEELPAGILNSISEIHYTPSKTDKYHINMFMNDGFEVSGTIRTFAKKMIYYPSIISQLDPKKKGVIDLEVGSFFTEYEQEGAQEKQDEKGQR